MTPPAPSLEVVVITFSLERYNSGVGQPGEPDYVAKATTHIWTQQVHVHNSQNSCGAEYPMSVGAV